MSLMRSRNWPWRRRTPAPSVEAARQDSRRAALLAAVESLESRQLLAAQLAITDTVAPNNDRAAAFGTVTVNGTSATQTFTLTNNGDTGLNVTNFSVAGANPGDFIVTPKTNLNKIIITDSFTVPAGTAYTVQVQFKPTAANARAAIVTFNTNDPDPSDASVTLQLSGAGQAGPVLQVTDNSGSNSDKAVALPNTAVGATSAAQVFSLKNNGGQTLNVTNFAVGGANPGDFLVTVKNASNATVSGASFSIAAGQTFTAEVRFKPTATGSRAANITFNTNDAGNPSVTLAATGTGSTTGASLTVTDSSGTATDKAVALPGTQVGSTSAPQTFTLTNNGGAALNVTNFALSNTADFDVQVTSDTGTAVNGTSFSVPAGKAYTVSVRFSPGTAGARTGSITFNTNDPANATVTLAATGTATNTTNTVPDSPTGLDAVAQGPRTIKLTWQDKSDNETGFKLFEAKGVNGTFTQVATPGANATSFTRNNLEPGVRYFYRLQATNAVGDSTSGSADDAITPEPADGFPNSVRNSRPVSVAGDRTFNEFIGDDDTTDLYRFTLKRSTQLRATVTDLQGDLDLQLLKVVNRKGKARVIAVSDGPDLTNDSISRSLARGTYVLKVLQGGRGVFSFYDLNVRTDVGGDSLDAGRNLGLVTKVTTIDEFVGSGDANDFYRFSLGHRQRVRFSLARLSADADIQVFDSDGNIIGKGENGGSSSEQFALDLSGGRYFVRVYPGEGGASTNYRLMLKVLKP